MKNALIKEILNGIKKDGRCPAKCGFVKKN